MKSHNSDKIHHCDESALLGWKLINGMKTHHWDEISSSLLKIIVEMKVHNFDKFLGCVWIFSLYRVGVMFKKLILSISDQTLFKRLSLSMFHICGTKTTKCCTISEGAWRKHDAATECPGDRVPGRPSVQRPNTQWDWVPGGDQVPKRQSVRGDRVPGETECPGRLSAQETAGRIFY